MSDAYHQTPERWILRTELLWAFGVGVLVAATIGMILFTALTRNINPPSNVERIDPNSSPFGRIRRAESRNLRRS
jgi:uncharacterized BrkB/YihY/UPF0761 family membrane protein